MNATMSNDSLPETIPEEEEHDDEVRLAMEMALAAAQNPGLSPTELRELVGKKNRQADIVDQVKKDKEQKAKDDAEKKWNEQKETVYSWLSGAAEKFNEHTSKIRAAAETLQNTAEQQLYADKIRDDKTCITLRKKIKAVRKTFKAKRLAGNRVSTRHRFKRHRMEGNLLNTEERIEKARKLFMDSNYNLSEYGKAVIRAGRKYKSSGSKEEENLESLLCRNMHQMLSIDKQKAKMRKANKETKKYLQRCKSWITDKQSYWEMNISTLEASQASMKALYEDTLAQQDKLIQKLQQHEYFQSANLADVDVSYFDEIPANAGPRGMLCALRGLPFSDSIRVTKSSGASVKSRDSKAGKNNTSSGSDSHKGERKELIIETASDDVSVNSALSDPDGVDDFDGTLSQASGFGFGDDAPWNLGDSSLSPSKQAHGARPAAKHSMKADLRQPPSTISTPLTVSVPELKAPPPTSSTDPSSREKQAVSPAADDEDGATPNPAEEEEEETENNKPLTEASKVEKNGADTVETTACSTMASPEA